ncbi:iron (metal) dependent repressor, DtxR family [Methanolobus vulcani]|jgi:Mn-dependent transcriptional regulator|uniref:Iron (Metal) dependent repressor, DtxR family n=1 Tax=Methanolobus vulcani TaxID=38026 RepID=A0A7Z7AXI6_9EURY|nr:metal-dependent transcriptional regulator [Methanolobus vulcani]SDF30643.1 iron (metal) dependent repressor, DtxR family [Methanolobus vulcani]
MTTERTEDYLKVIEKIIERKGYAQVKDVSRELEISSPSVTGMFKKLTKMGFINYEKYGGVTLTPEGEKIAKCTMEKHGVIKDFLLILGLDKEIADQDACKIEHVLAPETFETLTKFVEFMNMKDEWPYWLDHFNYYCETGEYIDCSPAAKDTCPIHGKNHNKK